MSERAEGSRCRYRVLCVATDAAANEIVREALAGDEFDVVVAESDEHALETANRDRPGLILLQAEGPDARRFELLRRLVDEIRPAEMPVVVYATSAGPRVKAEGLEMGAVDFLSGALDPVELRARVRVALRNRRTLELLEERAHRDRLTGLGNRHALEDRLPAELEACSRRGSVLAVLIVDLDHFKTVNDVHGHAVGDELLKRAAQVFRSVVRSADFVARYGGEEFVVVAPDCDTAGGATIGERLRRELGRVVLSTKTGTVRITASVGVASSDEVPAEPYALLAAADRALYRAKAAGRDRVERDAEAPDGASWCVEPEAR